MATGNQLTDKSQSSSLANFESSEKMQGWFKLLETIRKSDPPSNQPVRRLPNSNLNHTLANGTLTKQQNSFGQSLQATRNTNDHLLDLEELMDSTITLDSPPNIFNSPSMLSMTSTPQQIIDDILSVENELRLGPRLRRESVPSLEIEPTTISSASSSASISSDSKRSPTRLKKLSTRKTTKPKETVKVYSISTPITEDISDDDIPLVDVRKRKIKSNDALSCPFVNDSNIPLATDLQSLPGHIQDETRDVRFLNYIDIDTLSMHLTTCLYLDKQSSTRQRIFKIRTNALDKIFKIYYLKTLRKNSSLEKEISFIKKDHQKQQPLSLISSPTSASFQMDWTVNRRHSSSTYRQKPNNFFHILQVKPRKEFFLPKTSTSSVILKSPQENFESIKDILARTYYPHLHTAIEYGYQFGEKSKFPNTQQLIPIHDDIILIKEMPESPYIPDDLTTITLRSPVSFTRRDSTIIQQPITIMKRNERTSKTDENLSLSSIDVEHRMNNGIDELASWKIKKSVVVLTPTKIPFPSMIEREKQSNTVRKRKLSNTTHTNMIENKKKRIIPSTSSEVIHSIEDISHSESEDDVIPSQLPKQSFIKNGLRSNYYKTTNDNKSKLNNTKTRLEQKRLRQRQSSGSLPSFYTGIFESDDDKSSYIDYRLPYDIYWHGQQKSKQTTKVKNLPPPSATTPIFQHQKKKSNKPKQKQPLPYQKILRNIYTDRIRQNLLSSYNAEKAPVCDCKSPNTCEDGTCLNRMIFTECSSSCACGTKCSNQKIRKNHWFKHLEIFDTSKYGQGLRTTTPIPKGTFLCEYVGEVITDEKFHERMINTYSKDEHHYTMKLTQNLVIDAYCMGNVARFANHSCSPNCEFEKWTVDGLQRMCMFSSRTIKAGEELTYDYNFQSFNLQAQQPCYCESPKCRGKIGAKQPTTTITTTNNHTHHNSTTMQKITQREKRMILQSSIFLLRNLKRIKAKKELRKKTSNKLKQQTVKQSALSLFFTQNYYHSIGLTTKSTPTILRKTPKLSHKDLFYLFYNHIRRSHFVKTGRYHHELIDNTCYYAQLAQLTLLLNEIFESILYYKCTQDSVTPAHALRKCPSKRLYPAYYEVITKPIDLTMIKNKLEHGEYFSFDIFEQDFILLFQNAITYCGTNSDETSAVIELQDYFLTTLKTEYKNMLDLFIFMEDEQRTSTNLHTLENFIARLHDKEIIEGQVREILYDIIYSIDENSNNNSPIAYKIVLDNKPNSHRTSRFRASSDCIVHCRCGSVFDEISLVQCYACQLWQHVACVSIVDSSRPYYCFECQPTCEHNPSVCLKTNVLIAATLSPLQTYDDNHNSYSTLTRSDGFVIRINECYFVPKQDENNIDRSLTSPEYDILFIERLWLDDYGIGQASGYYYIRPNETFHEPNRKFFPNEVFRFPSSNDPLPISSIVRPCFVLDIGTYCKGKPISDNSSRVLSSDLFICEYRVDKSARTFTRLVKSRHFGINLKSYCFDNYVDKLSIKREYQPYQKEVQQQHHDNRRLTATSPNKLTNKQLEERYTRINGTIEKIYRRYHNQSLLPTETKYTIDDLFQQPSSMSSNAIGDNTERHNSSTKRKSCSIPSLKSPAGRINRKRHTISLSSDDDIVEFIPENDGQRISKKRLLRQRTTSSRKHDETIDQI